MVQISNRDAEMAVRLLGLLEQYLSNDPGKSTVKVNEKRFAKILKRKITGRCPQKAR